MSFALVAGEHLFVLHALANKLVIPVAKRFGEGRGGGSLCIATPTGLPLLTVLIGLPEEAKAQKYLHLSREKALRLAFYKDHMSSFESAKEEQERYPGAVRGSNVIGSFSGLPWKVDEGFVIALFRLRGMITDVQVDKIVQTSQNELAGSVYRLMFEEAKVLNIV